MRTITTPRQKSWGNDRTKPTHLFIPDTQVKPGVPIEHILWAAIYAIDKRIDCIVIAADWWDFPSLSHWEDEMPRTKVRRYLDDFRSGYHAWRLFFDALKKARKYGYRPRVYITWGNHEDRLRRSLLMDERWDGALPTPWDASTEDGVVDFQYLQPFRLDGVAYCHVFVNPMSGKPWGGALATRLKNIGFSFTQGHQQIYDTTMRTLSDGTVQRGMVAGAFYQHDEDYKGPQGNNHWRGIVFKTEVSKGNYNIVEVSLDFLRRRYGSLTGRIKADSHYMEDRFTWQSVLNKA